MMVQVIRRTPATPRLAARLMLPIDGLLNAEVFRALSDPTRLRLLACLAKCARPCSVGEVAGCCAVDLSVVSRHLAALERVGLLEASRQGRVVNYRVRFAEVSGMLRALADAFDACGESGCYLGRECCGDGPREGGACGSGCC
ncbi:MAG: ArsR/SmtB family transcription factor [Phycisphaerales bacterium]